MSRQTYSTNLVNICLRQESLPAVRLLKNKKNMFGIGSVISSIMNSFNAEADRKANRENMYIQSSLNRAQYDYERQVESPSNMVRRFEEAGLNPALAYGGAGASFVNGSSISGTTATSQSTGNPYRITPPSIVEISESRLLNEERKGKEIDNETRSDANLLALMDKRAQISKTLSETDKNSAEYENLKKEQELIQARIDNIMADTTLKGEQTETERSKQNWYSSDTTLKGEQTETERSKQNWYSSDSNLKDKLSDKTSEETSQLKEQRGELLNALISNNYLKDEQAFYYAKMTEKLGSDIELLDKELANYDLKLYAMLSQMTSSELRGWVDVILDYKAEKEKSSNHKSTNKIALLRILLPYLLKTLK